MIVMFKVYDSLKIFFTCLIYIIDMKKNIVIHIKIIILSPAFSVVKLKWYWLRVMLLISTPEVRRSSGTVTLNLRLLGSGKLGF